MRWALLCRRIAEGSSQGETGQFKCERHAVTIGGAGTGTGTGRVTGTGPGDCTAPCCAAGVTGVCGAETGNQNHEKLPCSPALELPASKVLLFSRLNA